MVWELGLCVWNHMAHLHVREEGGKYGLFVGWGLGEGAVYVYVSCFDGM